MAAPSVSSSEALARVAERRPSATADGGPYVLSGEDIGEEVARRVFDRVLQRAESAGGPSLEEVAYETVYAERRRLARAEPNPRTGADSRFIAWLRRELAFADEPRRRELVATVIERYTQEIAGHFDRRVYRLATRVVPPALGLLLHGHVLPKPADFRFEDRILLEGEVDALRRLTKLGTVVLAPTHVSNLDSLVLGVVIDRLGLPPFAYGAGLNLFSNELIGFFMRHLGAYTVDRAKTDPLYRTTLKEYTTVLLERGQHCLFFPGGTRSRSGAIESKLKLGLLGTAPVAFRRALEANAPRPRVFVVPCTLTYPLVLEAASLISEYLRTEGGAQYVDVRDEFDRPRRWLDFMLSLRALDERVHVRVSRPLDWLGNDVAPDGGSRDAHGRPLDPARYLLAGGRLVDDPARDAEYTRLLASRILASYRRDNVAVPTSLVAFVLFEHFRREHPRLGLFRLLRNLCPERGVAEAALLGELDRALGELARLEGSGAIHRSAELVSADARRVLQHALDTFATYHASPVVERVGSRVHVRDPELLFYYGRRLEGYGLLGDQRRAPALGPASTRVWP